MKKLLIVLIALGLLLAVVTIAHAQTYIWLWDADGGTFTVAPGEYAGLYITWGTCNRGLIRAFQNAANIELTLDGAPLYQSTHKDPYWVWTWDFPSEDCIPSMNSHPNGNGWQYPLELPPGEYEIGFTIWLDNQITDGYDSDGDGIPDFFAGVMGEGSFTLIFE